MNSSTDTHLTMEDCPALEDLAAFLDGTLPAEERERIVAHLADCEACYGIFAGAAHFQLEFAETQGGVVPFPFEDKKVASDNKEEAAAALGLPSWKATSNSRWLAAAALVVLSLGVGTIYRTYFVQPEMTVADLTRPVLEAPGVEKHVHEWDVFRGIQEKNSPYDRAAVVVGGLLVDLRLHVQERDVKQAANTLHAIAVELNKVGLMDEMEQRFREQVDATKSVADLERISEALPDWEQELDEDSVLLPELLAFGKWAEAGLVAARLREPEFFEEGRNRRFLRWLLRQPEKETGILGPGDEEVLLRLQEIESLWAAEQRNYKELAAAFDGIIEHYENQHTSLDEEAPIGL